MHRSLRSWLAGALAAFFVIGCSTVPYTKRRQFVLISQEQEAQLGLQAFQEIKQKEVLSKDPQINALVERVGRRVADVSDKPEFQWEFIAIDDPKTMNAFCLPGGKVGVYTGLLPVTKDDNGLAVVMSHEVAHALAHHGAERLSQQMAAGLAMDVLLSGSSPAAQNAVALAYGVGVGLPHGRKQESESDEIGLILMAKAGYDPRGAVEFWRRMQAANKGGSPPEFLSSHPSDDRRIRDIQEKIPEALKHYTPGVAR